MRRRTFEAHHDEFRNVFRVFVAKEMLPRLGEWERAGQVSRDLFVAAGDHGFIGTDVEEALGGGGTKDFRFNQIMNEEFQLAGVGGAGAALTNQNDLCIPYIVGLSTAEQRERWLPGLCDGSLVAAIAMTEPAAGSDLVGMRSLARPKGADFELSGSKTFITNGINADLVIVAAKLDPAPRSRSLVLLVIERDMKGFERGRNLQKIGLHSQDTAELFFDNVPVPQSNVLGEPGKAMSYLATNLVQERLSIATSSIGAAQAALQLTLRYTREREAFGAPISSFQNTKFKLAEMATEIEGATHWVDQCVLALNSGVLTGDDAAMAKWWCTEMQKRVVDEALQLHGGYGYMLESAIARAYVDGRVSTIFGGTTEIMKEIIGRSLVGTRLAGEARRSENRSIGLQGSN